MAMFRTKWNSVGLPENPLPLILFFKKWRIYMCGKYQREILGPSSPDSVAIFEKKLGKTFYWVFFKPVKRVDFWSKLDKFKRENWSNWDLRMVWECILKLSLYIYSNKLYITYCAVLCLKQSLIAAFLASWTVS